MTNPRTSDLAAVPNPPPLLAGSGTIEYRSTTVHYWTIGADRIEASAQLAATHPHFAGHFPGFPIFPAVSQVDLVCRVVEAATGHRPRVRQFRRCKFLAMLRPGSPVSLTVERSSDCVRWELRSGEQLASKGQFEYE
jgi:3-hydroxyacyl-[acyl-carrier-protein] dehydratase